MFETIQIIFFILGMGLAYFGNRFSMPVLFHGGIVCLGFFTIAVGWEAIITKQISLGSRRSSSRRTYTGLAAIMHGIQFNLIGIFLIIATAIIYFNYEYLGREIFLYFIRRPGVPLLFFGMLFLMQAVIVMAGTVKVNLSEETSWSMILNLLFSRLLPGLIMVVLGVGAIGLGLFEIVAPSRFDELGGGFLEVIYGLK